MALIKLQATFLDAIFKQGIGDPCEGAPSAHTSHLLGARFSVQMGRKGKASTPAACVQHPLGWGAQVTLYLRGHFGPGGA